MLTHPPLPGAKRACRRREVAVEGVRVLDTSLIVQPGQTVEVLARAGAGGCPSCTSSISPVLCITPGLKSFSVNVRVPYASMRRYACCCACMHACAGVHLQARHQTKAPAADAVKLEVLYEDDHMACIIKPQGLPSQGKGRPA